MRILATFFSIFFSLAISFAEPNFIVNGKIVTEKEYNEAKSLQLVNVDTFSEINEENLARNWAGDISLSNLNQNEHIPSIDRNSDEFDIHLNFHSNRYENNLHHRQN